MPELICENAEGSSSGSDRPRSSPVRVEKKTSDNGKFEEELFQRKIEECGEEIDAWRNQSHQKARQLQKLKSCAEDALHVRITSVDALVRVQTLACTVLRTVQEETKGIVSIVNDEKKESSHGGTQKVTHSKKSSTTPVLSGRREKG